MSIPGCRTKIGYTKNRRPAPDQSLPGRRVFAPWLALQELGSGLGGHRALAIWSGGAVLASRGRVSSVYPVRGIGAARALRPACARGPLRTLEGVHSSTVTKAQPVKTNAARYLEGLGIAFEIRTYEVDNEDLSAETVARKVGLPLEQVWKTLVARGDRTGVLFAVVAADQELDPKALAAASANRRVDLVPLAEVQPLTGYVRGGVTVFGSRKAFPVFADESMTLHGVVAVSSGMRGAQILLSPDDYVRAASVRLAPISRPKC